MARNGGDSKVFAKTVTIGRSAEELYRFWRDLDKLSMIMGPLRSVTEMDGSRSRWIADGPNGTEIEWHSEITQDVENETIVWRSVDDAKVDTEGSVVFRPLDEERGTEVHVTIRHMNGEKSGHGRVFGDDPDAMLRESLRRFKQIMEAGEVPRTLGQSRGHD